MQSVVLIALAALVTSTVAYTIGIKWFGLNCLALGKAGLKTLETVGMGAIFFGANLATGMIVIAAVHALTGSFVSHYILSDVSLLSLSLLQGIVFAWWHRASERVARSRTEPMTPPECVNRQRTSGDSAQATSPDSHATWATKSPAQFRLASSNWNASTTEAVAAETPVRSSVHHTREKLQVHRS